MHARQAKEWNINIDCKAYILSAQYNAWYIADAQ